MSDAARCGEADDLCVVETGSLANVGKLAP